MSEVGTRSVNHDKLKILAINIYKAVGMSEDNAEFTAEVQVRTDLRGVDSHGVAMLARYYEGFTGKLIEPRPQISVVRESQTTALVDGGNGLGHPVSGFCMEICMEKAERMGAAFVTARNSNHFGPAGYYPMMALPRDMIGICMTNYSVPFVVPTFGSKPMFATNPIGIAIPADKEPPFVLDMATSTVAVGKLAIAMRKEEPIPEGWAMDSSGEATTDPRVGLDSRRLTPLGGSRELGSHKGYGLAVMVDVLSGVLSGAAYGDLMEREGTLGTSPANVGHFFGAIRVDSFRPLDEFKAAMDDMLRALKNSPKAEGHDRIYVAGEIEYECEQERLKNGIPLNQRVVDDLERIAGELGVSFDI